MKIVNFGNFYASLVYKRLKNYTTKVTNMVELGRVKRLE